MTLISRNGKRMGTPDWVESGWIVNLQKSTSAHLSESAQGAFQISLCCSLLSMTIESTVVSFIFPPARAF
jgi:hypothetical protein